MASDITHRLRAWKRGDREAAEQLALDLYNELRRIARKHMRQERSGHTLQTTALVNEAYLRLMGVRREFHALDDALSELSRRDPRKARAIELRFFGGLSVEETAAALSVSPQTVLRDWSRAKAWLTRELSHARPS